ncbi:MAG TPA: hypothetical protein PKA27_01595 [Fimbriimonadaceae bacterium]|nr:hypothetical protein [Fimbriimonadaceae bacterium]
MELVRYRPGEAIRWLDVGAQDMRRSAKKAGQRLINREGERTISRDFRDAAGVLIDLGKSALAELKNRQAEASEFVLHEDRFEVVSPGKITSVRYDQVKHIKLHRETVKLILDHGGVTIKPHAYIVSGRVRVPIGWSRNGLEVPYETLLEELSGRSGVNIEHLT